MTPRTNPDPELRITVVAFTGGGGAVEMTDEIALVKAALLYADRVTLASPKAILFAAFAGYLTASPSERRQALLELFRSMPGGAEQLAAYQAVQRKRDRTAAQIIASKRMEAGIEQATQGLAAKIEEMLEQANAWELERAMQAGLVDLDPLGVSGMDNILGDEMLAAVRKLIADLLAPESTAYPMFSELTGGVARAMLQEGTIQGAALAPATQVGVAGQFISALEAFPDAPMDVVLDARERLRGPLRKFRGGITRISRDLGGLHALDPQFRTATNDLYREHVAPALEEIQTLTREMGLLTALARSAPTVARDVALAAAPVIALAVTSASGVEQLAALAGQFGTTAVGAGATALDLLGRATSRQRVARDQRDRNEFIFLFEANRELRR